MKLNECIKIYSTDKKRVEQIKNSIGKTLQLPCKIFSELCDEFYKTACEFLIVDKGDLHHYDMNDIMFYINNERPNTGIVLVGAYYHEITIKGAKNVCYVSPIPFISKALEQHVHFKEFINVYIHDLHQDLERSLRFEIRDRCFNVRFFVNTDLGAMLDANIRIDILIGDCINTPLGTLLHAKIIDPNAVLYLLVTDTAQENLYSTVMKNFISDIEITNMYHILNYFDKISLRTNASAHQAL